METSLISVRPHETENRTRRYRRRAMWCQSRIYPTLTCHRASSIAILSATTLAYGFLRSVIASFFLHPYLHAIALLSREGRKDAFEYGVLCPRPFLCEPRFHFRKFRIAADKSLLTAGMCSEESFEEVLCEPLADNFRAWTENGDELVGHLDCS